MGRVTENFVDRWHHMSTKVLLSLVDGDVVGTIIANHD